MNVLEALDDGIAALSWLRRQAAEGQLDEEALQSLLTSGLLDHELLRGALSALEQEQRSASEAAAGPADQPPPVADDASDEPSSAGSGEPSGEESGEDEPPSPHREAEQLVAALVALPGALKKLGVHVPGQTAEFCKKAGRAAHGLADDDKKGELLAALLFKGMAVLDGVEHALIWSGHRAGLKSVLDGLRGPMAAFLDRAHDLIFVPPVDLNRIDPDNPPQGVAVDWVPAHAPAGTVLAVLSRAFRRDDSEGGESRLIVARGEPGELRSRLLEIWQRLESDGAGDPAADLAKLSRWIRELDDDDQAALTSTARHVLNLIHDRNADGAHGADIKWLLAALGRQGITELIARVGRRFDDSYSPSKYERQLVYSDQPAGTIVRIVRLGLLDSGGVPLQKTVLGVSRGNN